MNKINLKDYHIIPKASCGIFFYLLQFLMIFLLCSFIKQELKPEKNYEVQVVSRFYDKYYCIYISSKGTAYVQKGYGSDFRDSLIIKSSFSSNSFVLDSATLFFHKLNMFQKHPMLKGPCNDANRVEIFYGKRKVYDGCGMEAEFWSLVDPIIQQIPTGFNPFRLDEKPF